MTALWYDMDGYLVPAPFQDGRRYIRRPSRMASELVIHVEAEMPTMAMAPLRLVTEEVHRVVKGKRTIYVAERVRFTRAARRQAARRGSGPGRRHAARVATSFETVSQVTLPAIEALLYLPTGESVTQRSLDDVERWIERNGASR
ncbi:hypothetical protein [Sorangium sp. So ce1024]|uniref:hypothetical protein n=1 Tax=Sorangium sp. So ce1024 TaxID=3133327 RepID=UPI003EFBB3F8